MAGEEAFTLYIWGNDFTVPSIFGQGSVNWNGQWLPTTYTGVPSYLEATVSADKFAFPGTVTIYVRNWISPILGVDSNKVTFQIKRYPNPPVIHSIVSPNPPRTQAGGPAFDLVVYCGNGELYDAEGIVVLWNGQPRVTTHEWMDGDDLFHASILLTDIATAGKATVQVQDRWGQKSNAVTFTITAPVSVKPTIISLMPSSRPHGTKSFILTVNGINFQKGAQVRWNGASPTTTYISSVMLRASISALAIKTVGTRQVKVVNPSGKVSNTVTFSIT